MGFIKIKSKGYTFIEVIVAVAIFSFVLTITTTIMINFYNAQKKERIRNTLIEETQFLVNRISNLIRNNTIDYSEYYAKGRETSPPSWINYDPNFEYGKWPKEYEWHFYYAKDCNPGDGPTDCTRENENNFNEGYFDTFTDNSQGEVTGNDDSTLTALRGVPDNGGIGPYLQRELYLVNLDGTQKTILRRTSNGIDDDDDGVTDEDNDTFWLPGVAKDGFTPFTDGGERISILKLSANTDFFSLSTGSGTPSTPEPDGILDFETESNDFQHDGDHHIELEDFIPISPRMINIKSLQFFISPLEDPRKAFSETNIDTQIQPHVTILVTTEPGQQLMRQLTGDPFEISIQTTVVSRTLSNIVFPSP
jgi:prepilin-type N-terminal cleavage/methylation domain-containing protein